MKPVSRVIFRALTVWGTLLALLRRHPVIAIPFLLIGCTDLILLAVIFFMMLPPLSALTAPLVGALWGEEYFHYPLNVYLLPKVFSYIRNIAGLFVGVVLTAVTVAMVNQAVQGNRPSWHPALKKGFRKYSSFAAVWAIALGLAVLVMRMMEQVYTMANSHEIRGIAGFFSAMLIQMLFFYAIPSVGIENKKIGAALRRSFALFRRYPFETAILVLAPNLLVFPLIYAYTNMRELVRYFSPEVMLYVMVTRIAVLLAVNFIVISSATVLLIAHRRWEKSVHTGQEAVNETGANARVTF